jgi:hypothetical protein
MPSVKSENRKTKVGKFVCTSVPFSIYVRNKKIHGGYEQKTIIPSIFKMPRNNLRRLKSINFNRHFIEKMNKPFF